MALTPNIATASFTVPGGTASRPMEDRAGDVVNVKDYGATGNGSTNDTASVQAAIDAAFGSNSNPHGANTTLNRKLVFPPGDYLCQNGLNFKQVRGGVVEGSGVYATRLSTGRTPFISVNGMEQCFFSGINFSGVHNGSSFVCLELDWDGTNTPAGDTIGLSGNIFQNCNFGNSDYCVRIAFSGNQGWNNQFLGCSIGDGNTAKAGLVTWGANAYNNIMQGGGGTCIGGPVLWQKAGQIALIEGFATSQPGSNYDFLIDTPAPVALVACRSESLNFLKITSTQGTAHLRGVEHTNNGNSSLVTAVGGAKVTVDAVWDMVTNNARLTTDVTATGTVYLRGCTVPSTVTSGPNLYDTFIGNYIAQGGIIAQRI